MTHREIIRNNLNKSDWEITKDKCDSTRAHRRHLAANGKHETERKTYCTNVHLRIIGILITSVYNSVLSLLPLHLYLCKAYPGLPKSPTPDCKPRWGENHKKITVKEEGRCNSRMYEGIRRIGSF